jgi:hypothetical protein
LVGFISQILIKKDKNRKKIGIGGLDAKYNNFSKIVKGLTARSNGG